MILQAPFPWFGGKRRVAPVVWNFFGDVPNYVEPFFGSGAVLLNRPHKGRCETVNDLDCYLSNFWRALQFAPEEIAFWADWPVNEADLHARHLWLVQQHGMGFRELMRSDPHFFDAKIAGWWVWGISQWIGSGWCAKPEWEGRVLAGRAPRGIHTHKYQQRPMLHSSGGVHSQRAMNGRSASSRAGTWKTRPYLTTPNGNGIIAVASRLPDLGGNSGAYGKGVHASARLARVAGLKPWLKRPKLDGLGGVHALAQKYPNMKRGLGGGIFRAAHLVSQKRPILKGGSVGVHAKRPALTNRGGVHGARLARQMPLLSGDAGAYGRGVQSQLIRENLLEYMHALADRLRRVRVCCGDWKRILGPSPTTCIGTTAVLLDPPYSKESGRDAVYSVEDFSVAHAVREWAIEQGENPKLRIAVCGYDGEHKFPRGWKEIAWKTNGGYGNQARGRGFANAARERIWFSPHCLKGVA